MIRPFFNYVNLMERGGGETEETDDDASKKRQWMGKEDCCIFFALPLLPKPHARIFVCEEKGEKMETWGFVYSVLSDESGTAEG